MLIKKDHQCSRCGKWYPNTLEYFRKRSGTGRWSADRRYRLDPQCRDCRKLSEGEYRKAHPEKCAYVRKGANSERNHSPHRDTLASFRDWMLKNPAYFTEIFEREPTEENIVKCFYEAQEIRKQWDIEYLGRAA